MAPSMPKVAFMEEIQQEARHRHRPRAVQGRRRRRQQHADRHDADRDLRHRQPDPVHPHGKIVGFAVDGDKRSPLAPDIPTFKEIGYTDTSTPAFFGIYAPTGTPKPIIDKFNQAIVKVASKPEFQKRT